MHKRWWWTTVGDVPQSQKLLTPSSSTPLNETDAWWELFTHYFCIKLFWTGQNRSGQGGPGQNRSRQGVPNDLLDVWISCLPICIYTLHTEGFSSIIWLRGMEESGRGEMVLEKVNSKFELMTRSQFWSVNLSTHFSDFLRNFLKFCDAPAEPLMPQSSSDRLKIFSFNLQSSKCAGLYYFNPRTLILYTNGCLKFDVNRNFIAQTLLWKCFCVFPNCLIS